MTKPSEIHVDVYGSKDVPAAAKAGVGARDLSDIQKATDARRAQSDANKPRQYER
jgi:hypothetical protein